MRMIKCVIFGIDKITSNYAKFNFKFKVLLSGVRKKWAKSEEFVGSGETRGRFVFMNENERAARAMAGIGLL